MSRRALLLLAAVAVVGYVAAPAHAADSSHEGTVVSAGDGKLTMTGSDKKEHSHMIGANVKITVDGKAGKLEDLKAGQHIKVTTNDQKEVTKVEATTAKKPEK